MDATAEQKYNLGVVRWFTVMAVVYLVVGTLVGTYIASELAWPFLNFDIPYITFGRLRPLHTNAVIFAFGGSVLMATSFYSVQRTCGVNLWSDKLAWFVFWGWNLIIVSAVITLPLGINQTKEYAELEWPIDLAIAVVWLAYMFNFVMTLATRKSSHIYVSNWFFLAMMIMITYLHVVNSLAIPVSLFKSYSLFSGVQDAMIQWWWGHNAVGFYLTAGFLGIMYYFVPKQAGRPVYSYRLSVIHFWALTFGYVWLGAHHLQYTALPDWTGSLGAAVSRVHLCELERVLPADGDVSSVSLLGKELRAVTDLRAFTHAIDSGVSFRVSFRPAPNFVARLSRANVSKRFSIGALDWSTSMDKFCFAKPKANGPNSRR